MPKLLYNLFITLYPFVIRLLSAFNKKAKLWVKGRKNIWNEIKTNLQNDDSKKIWFHAASLGEFEQGRPLMEALKKDYPRYKIVLTFFSPSGYENQKKYKGADYIFYMPIDSKHNAAMFYDIVKPSLVIFIKYEYWLYYLVEAGKRKIPVLLVSGVFLPQFSFFKWYGSISRKMLQYFTHLFLQNESSLYLLKTININNASVSGDTRFDRVLEVANNFKPIKEIEAFCKGKTTIIAGSTWTEDDEALDHYTHIHPEICFIVAPHDISKGRIDECKKLYRNVMLYSEIKSQQLTIDNKNVLIIDNIGMLKNIYNYATVCLIGGGFKGNGIHNVLEAAVYYKPVIFGPEYSRFSEATELVNKGGAFSVDDALQLEERLDELLNNKVIYNEACCIAGEYVREKTGATDKILKYIQENRLLIN